MDEYSTGRILNARKIDPHIFFLPFRLPCLVFSPPSCMGLDPRISVRGVVTEDVHAFEGFALVPDSGSPPKAAYPV